MGKIGQTIEQLKKFPKLKEPYWVDALRYLETGDRAALAKLARPAGAWCFWLTMLQQAMAQAGAMAEDDIRVLHVLAACRQDQSIGLWLSISLWKEPPDGDFHGRVASELRGAGMPEPTILALTAGCVARLSRDGQPTSAGRYVLSRPLDELKAALGKDALADDLCEGAHLAAFLRDFARDRLVPLLPLMIEPGRFTPGVAEELLKANDPACDQAALSGFRSLPNNVVKLETAKKLVKHDRAQYGAEMLKFAQALLRKPAIYQPPVATWLAETYGEEVLEDIRAYLETSKNHARSKTLVMAAAVKALGARAIPAVLEALRHEDPATRNAALGHLIALDDGTHADAIRAGFDRCLESTDAEPLIATIGLAARAGALVPFERIWPLLDHKSKPLREAAARALGRLGDEAVPRAEEMLVDKKAVNRVAAVTLLTAAGTPRALAALEARVDLEGDEDVRDAMLIALDAARTAGGREVTLEEAEARVDRVAAKVKNLPASWLDASALPPLHDHDGRPLRPEAVRYLLYRQSRVKEMRPDVEAKPLYARIDRATSGDFALDVLKRFAGSKAAPEDRWALAIASLLGDDRAVPVLSSLVNQWAESSRGKMAEYAVQALALLGTDAALTTLNALSIRYRTKLKNIGQAAVDAFEAAAARMGVTPDELGDRVVPWLGFAADAPRRIDCGGRTIEASIGPDFKIKFRDTEKNKPVASLPKSASKPVQDEFKGLAATLREVVKSQVLRLENLMVRQHRWPVARWRELFLPHPVLLPFAIRLIWGHYDDGGALLGTFRALEDRTLTNAADEPLTLPAEGSVGMVHPLELDDEVRKAWMTHLADYEVASPFPQLERPVVRVGEDRRATTMGRDVERRSVNALTFKGRAERLGWARGSVTDGGGVDSYRKTFPASGVDAFLGIDGLYMGIGMGEEINLGVVYFVKGGSVEVGSYTYDNPHAEDDPRLIPFGAVPPVVFSEVMGDLWVIAGASPDDQETD